MSKYHDIKVNKIRKYKSKKHKNHFDDKWKIAEENSKKLSEETINRSGRDKDSLCISDEVDRENLDDVAIKLNLIQRDYRNKSKE